jgi:signal transduction histidine kinase
VVCTVILKADRNRIVREFFAALADGNSYRPWSNLHALFGLLWGLPIPFFSLTIDLMARSQAFTIATMIECFRLHPIHLLFLFHPPAFLVLFGAMGTVRRRKEEKIQSLMEQIQQRYRDLQAAHKQLQTLDKLKDEFLATVTHELKTPLVSSSGYTEMMLKGLLGPVTAKQRHGLNVSLRNLRRLERQINDLLDFARIEAGGVQLHLTWLDLGELIEEVTNTLQPAFEAAQLVLELPDPMPRVSVRADREAMRSVLVNLAENAIKFSEPGGTVRIRLEGPRNGRLNVEVSDTGVGIPAEALPYVFDRFRQADGGASRRYGGAGLGLAIVKRFVEAHGGDVHVKSRPGEGTTFRLCLPTGQNESEPTDAGEPLVGERLVGPDRG